MEHMFLVCYTLFLLSSGVVSDTEVVNGTLGNHIYLNQSFSNPALLVQWYFKGNLIASRYPSVAPECISSYTGRCQIYDDGTLRLDNLTYSDDGIYRFTAVQPPLTTVKEASYELRVYPVLNAPVISSNSTSNNLIGGSYVSLHCNASGQTVTTYTFYRDGKNICSEPHVICQDSYLYFQPITGSNSGSYTCTIQNPVSTNTSRNSVQLNVIDPVSDVNVTSNVSGLVWPGLDSVSLICSAQGTNVTYLWSLQGAPLPKDPQYHLTENNRVLTINPVSDNGTFTCTAANSINSQTSNGVVFSLASEVTAVMVTSNVSGLVLVEQESVSLHCSAWGSAVKFSWSLNGEILPKDPQYHITQSDSPPQSNLIISPVSRSDAGLFTCTASNKLNNETSSGLTLSLALPPEGHMACLQGSSSQYIQLSCSWQGGKPAANVTMVFNGLSETGTNQVTRNVPENTSLEGLTMMCYGDYFGRPSNCEQTFAPSSCHGLSGGEVAGIVIGVVAGIAIIEVIVFFVLKTKKKPPLGTIYENSNVPPSHIYSTTIPGTEQLTQQNRDIYIDLKPSTGKR
ncbi:cell adhesion molecule CEACAM1-like isoform X3 [Lithobates pipiens]